MSESDSQGQRPKPAPAAKRAEPRSLDDLARELGGVPGAAPAASGEGESLRDVGRFRLDKSGALLGRAKLEPRKAHRPAGEEESATAERQAPVDPARPRKAALPPKRGARRPSGFPERAGAVGELARAAAGEDDELSIPAGAFLYGEGRQSREIDAFAIDRTPVTNAQYAHFVRATRHRPPLYWDNASYPDVLRDHPVVGVDYFDALAYARWAGKDLPFEDEWERAARGVDGRTYPWGNDQELSGANTARVGLKMTVPVDLHRANVSPEGVRDMVGNAWEITHSPAPGGGVVVRGGSWHDFALYAKTWFRFASKPEARNGTIGFRCVRRPKDDPRSAAPREVSTTQADAEIAARRGSQPVDSRDGWSAEKRDLILDKQRLMTYVAEARAQALLGAVTASVPVVADPTPVAAPAPAAKPAAQSEPAAQSKSAAQSKPAAQPKPTLQKAPAAQAKPVVVPKPPAQAGPPIQPKPPAVKHTAQAAATPARSESRKARFGAPGMPRTMWLLLGIGFLLFGGVLVMLVNRGDEDDGVSDLVIDGEPDVSPGSPTPRSPLADLPEAPRYEEFPGANEPPRVLDAAYGSDRERLDQGLWLLLIIDPRTEEGEQTLKTAHELHRRLEPTGVHVTVVLPRDPYEDADGRLVEDQALDDQLKADGRHWLWDGIHVVLDPATADGSGRGVLGTKYAFEGDRVAAMLLHDGQIQSRTAPPEGGFTAVSLVSLAKRAMELAR